MMTTIQRQSRSSNIMVNIEPLIHGIVLDLLEKEGMSASGYARLLIINDLRERGLLTDAMLAELTVSSFR